MTEHKLIDLLEALIGDDVFGMKGKRKAGDVDHVGTGGGDDAEAQ
jgi:hypothetical protein